MSLWSTSGTSYRLIRNSPNSLAGHKQQRVDLNQSETLPHQTCVPTRSVNILFRVNAVRARDADMTVVYWPCSDTNSQIGNG